MPNLTQAVPFPDDDVYSEPDVPSTSRRLRLVINSTPVGRTVRWCSSQTGEASHHSAVTREDHDAGHHHMICNFETLTTSDHGTTTTMTRTLASDTSMGMETTVADGSDGSLPSSTLCFPELLVINGAGNEINEEVSDDEQPVLAETSQDRHRRERANRICNIRRDPTLPVSIDEVTQDSENEQEVQSHRRRNQARQRRRDWQAREAKRHYVATSWAQSSEGVRRGHGDSESSRRGASQALRASSQQRGWGGHQDRSRSSSGPPRAQASGGI